MKGHSHLPEGLHIRGDGQFEKDEQFAGFVTGTSIDLLLAVIVVTPDKRNSLDMQVSFERLNPDTQTQLPLRQ